MLSRRFNYRAINHLAISHQGCLLWLVIAQLLAVMSHFSLLPLWLSVAVVGMVLLRYLISQGRINELTQWRKIAICGLIISLFLLTSRWQFTVELAVAFYVLAYSLKTLELKRTRDAFIFCFLTMFLLTLSLLFSQSLLTSVYIFLALGFCFFALMTINTPVPIKRLGGNLGRIYGILLLALPLLILFYLVFPRVGPLWSMPIKSNTAFTGLGETVAPGDVANLAQSANRAFRVAFSGAAPSSERLYWRSLVLDQFNGKAWTRSFYQVNREDERKQVPASNSDWDYEITVDPHNREWAFALQDAVVVDGNVYQTMDNLVRFKRKLKSPAEYRLATRPAPPAVLSSYERQHFLRLPAGSNPRADRWAYELSRQYPDYEVRIQALLSHFNQQDYYYTLKPPLLETSQRVDEFLFDSRKGFCEHYASSTAYMLRKMNIPARVVVGYQGGEWNSMGEFLVIHQYDAHAWVEAWIEGKGWVQYDPTAAVAPNRIESGIREAMAEEGSFLEDSPLALARFNHIATINWLRDQMESLNYQWIKMVVNYDQQRQQAIFKRWLGSDSILRLAAVTILLTVVFFTAVGLFALVPEWRRRRQQPVHFLFETLVAKLASAHPNVHVGMTPRQLLLSVEKKYPYWGELKDIVNQLESCLYRDKDVQQRDVRRLQQKVRGFKVVRIGSA